jgi:circadian clock protein KaiC
VFLFDERQSTYLARADALGMRASEMVEAGRLIVEQIEPGDTSPGQFSHRVKACVEEQQATMVGIDTLNGYMTSIPSSDAPLVRMHELLSFLSERNVATMICVAQHGIIGASMPVPLDISYLADAVILHRFFEAAGTVRRALSIVKKRTGTHETTIRELQLGPGRLFVGPPLSDFHGVLTGVPHYTGTATTLMDATDAEARRL